MKTASLACLFALFAIGCGDANSDSTTSQPATSIVPATVERAQFCGVFDKIACEVTSKCCAGADKPYATVEACMTASPCGSGVGLLLESPSVASGKLRYDATAAADYLRSIEARKSACEQIEAAPARVPFLTGTLEIGADCTPGATDSASALLCKPGSHCDVTENPMAGTVKGACVAGDLEVTVANVGATCASDEDCRASSCVASKCAVKAEGACSAPPANEAPSNAVPTQLGIEANGSNDGAGTSGTITLGYAIDQKYYECSIAGISKGETKYCNVTYTSTNYGASAGVEWFTVAMSSGDGLLFTAIKAKDAAGATIRAEGTFIDFTKADCTNCFAGSCGNCWLDADGHGGCKKLTIALNSANTLSCNN